MNRMRKWILTAMTALALAFPMATAPAAQAHSPCNSMNHSRTYYLYYRPCPDAPWAYVGFSNDYSIIQQWVSYLNVQGYQAFVR